MLADRKHDVRITYTTIDDEALSEKTQVARRTIAIKQVR